MRARLSFGDTKRVERAVATDEEIDVIVIELDSAGEIAEARVVAVNGVAGCFNGFDGLTEFLFGLRGLVFGVVKLCQAGVEFPFERGFRGGIRADLMKEFLGFRKMLSACFNSTGDQCGLANTEMVEALLFELHGLVIVFFRVV